MILGMLGAFTLTYQKNLFSSASSLAFHEHQEKQTKMSLLLFISLYAA